MNFLQKRIKLWILRARYDLGLGSIVELSQAQLNQAQAGIAQAGAKYDYATRLAELEYQEGALKVQGRALERRDAGYSERDGLRRSCIDTVNQKIYTQQMIGGFRHKGLEEIYLTGKMRRVGADHIGSAFVSCNCWKKPCSRGT